MIASEGKEWREIVDEIDWGKISVRIVTKQHFFRFPSQPKDLNFSFPLSYAKSINQMHVLGKLLAASY